VKNTTGIVLWFLCLIGGPVWAFRPPAAAVLSWGQSGEESYVIESFIQYKAAILNNQGAKAVEFLDEQTVEYFGRILRQVWSADKESLGGESFVNRLMVLLLRHMTPAQVLLEMDAQALLVHAIDNGWVGKTDLEGQTVRDVSIKGNFARAALYQDDQATGLSFYFFKEDGRWKLDLVSLMQISNQALKEMAAQSGLESEDAFILSIIESLSGRKVPSDIYKPLKR
jgi:hypothetical protein